MGVVASAMAQPALANDCVGTVNSSYLTIDGSVILRGTWRNDFTQICNLKTEWKGVTPDVCAGWKAMIDAALTLGRTVSLYYSPDVTCAQIPYYGGSPAPYYVMLL
jgi:hypothetical protein